MEESIITVGEEQINMDKRKLIIVGFVVLGVVALGVIIFLFRSKTPTMTTEQLSEENKKIELAKKIEFVVIRVLPSGFSPSEVTIKPGMIVRFTNPLKDKVNIKWEGDKQYTDGSVFLDNDIATEVFEKEGEYTFTDDAAKPHMGKVVVR